ncbi:MULTISPECIES: sensor histidine kinase [Niastella]|uniref:Sensor histidine kinase n=1 Tax=Niastella soli TaxID=2821487 RepID=A0ABS3YQR4_9BACT|nr:sensor histidine kinase [Niastella soli]MBO9200239.1 sensor histidine kinase [Niastella soli]
MKLPRPRWFLSIAFITQFLFWLTSLLLVIYVAATNQHKESVGLYSALLMGCHLTNFYVVYSFLVPRYYNKNNKLLAAGLLTLIIVLTYLRGLIEHQFTDGSYVLAAHYLNGKAGLGGVLFAEIFIAAFAFLLRLSLNYEIERARAIELENLHLQLELRFLKAQMNPHFLFNTLNNIYSLIVIKSDKAETALMRLSDLLRYMLYESSGKVNLQKELNVLYAYIELFQLRFEQDLPIEIINEVDCQAEIESLLLIPFMENAIKHSAVGVQPESTVFMKITSPGKDKLNIYMHNTKANPPIHQEVGGIGLVNIKKRLEILYPDKHELIIDENDHTFSIHLTIKVI